MMIIKRITSAILCIIFALSVYGCSGTGLKTGKEAPDPEGTEFDVSMDIVEGTVSPIGLTIRVTNNTGLEIYSGNAFDFSIEVCKNNRWYTVETGMRDNTDEAVIIEETREMEINWSDIYGTLPKGRYRIVKCFFPRTEDRTYGYDDRFNLAAEFSIE